MFLKSALSAVAAASAGAALLLATGAPQAFGLVDAGAPITHGAVEIEAVGATVAAAGPTAGDELVVVPGEMVTLTTTARVTVRGDGLSATLRLDTAELFAAAPTALREQLDAGVDVQLHGLAPVADEENAWVVPARSQPYDVTAVVSVQMPDLGGMQGLPLSTGELSWSVTQDPLGPGGPR